METQTIPHNLTQFQYNALELLSQGLTTPQIAQKLGKSIPNTESAIWQVFIKMGLTRKKSEAPQISRVIAATRFVLYQANKERYRGLTIQKQPPPSGAEL